MVGMPAPGTTLGGAGACSSSVQPPAAHPACCITATQPKLQQQQQAILNCVAGASHAPSTHGRGLQHATHTIPPRAATHRAAAVQNSAVPAPSQVTRSLHLPLVQTPTTAASTHAAAAKKLPQATAAAASSGCERPVWASEGPGSRLHTLLPPSTPAVYPQATVAARCVAERHPPAADSWMWWVQLHDPAGPTASRCWWRTPTTFPACTLCPAAALGPQLPPQPYPSSMQTPPVLAAAAAGRQGGLVGPPQHPQLPPLQHCLATPCTWEPAMTATCCWAPLLLLLLQGGILEPGGSAPLPGGGRVAPGCTG